MLMVALDEVEMRLENKGHGGLPCTTARPASPAAQPYRQIDLINHLISLLTGF